MTLIEMMVSVLLLVLLMTILVTIFASATGAIQEQQSYAALDMELRRLDATIRIDLVGSTAKMTPPNNPEDGRGYFEYAENALCDVQGEDSDDTLRFTVKAPEGKPFTGRLWVPRSVPYLDPGYPTNGNRSITRQATMVTATHAEVLYFLRNGNLYRRVLLINPQLAGRLHVGNWETDPRDPVDPTNTRTGPLAMGFATDMFRPSQAFVPYGLPMTPTGFPIAGWNGLNDISAVPSEYPGAWANANTIPPASLPLDDTQGPPGTSYGYNPVPTTLGMLTDRHNRAFNPRFANDYITIAYDNSTTPPTPSVGAYVPDGIPDDFNGDGVNDYHPTLYPSAVVNGFLHERDVTGAVNPTPRILSNDVLAFPYIFPQAYSQPDPFSMQFGWVHSLDPQVNPNISPTGQTRPTFGTFLDPPFNHNPLDSGDSAYRYANDLNGSGRALTEAQTWWGFPTWRETASAYALGNLRRINDPCGFGGGPVARFFNSLPPGFAAASEVVPSTYTQTALLSWERRLATGPVLPPQPEQLYSEAYFGNAFNSNYFTMPPNAVWEDDLLATNVRSFDVKAYDPNAMMWVPGNPNNPVLLTQDYYDLGYANLAGPGAYGMPAGVSTPPSMLGSFAHEGRMPPLSTDYRSDPQYPELNPNIGDDNPNLPIIRMRRVWDSWSTTYTQAPGLPMNPNYGPKAGLRPVLVSYPPPYPAPLRGIQIKIRMTDPDGKRVKNLTIRHDFTDKL